MTLKHALTHSFWYDLVFHVFSNLPVDSVEADCIYDSDYIRWADQLFPPEGIELRMLHTDASLIAVNYNNTEHGFYLHHFLQLYRDFAEFQAAFDSDFTELNWGDPHRKYLADAISQHIPHELLEMFRLALWSEATSGYLEGHAARIVPLYEHRLPLLTERFEALAENVKGLCDQRFMVSHPLRNSGRLLWEKAEPIMVVGLPDPDLHVADWFPAFQGCHEYILSRSFHKPEAFDHYLSPTDSDGVYALKAAKIIAYSIESRLFEDQHHEKFLEWLKKCFPMNSALLVSSLPWKIKNPPLEKGIQPLAQWFASGQAVPEELQDHYQTLLQFFE